MVRVAWIDAHTGAQEEYGRSLRSWKHAFAPADGEPEANGITLDPLHYALAAWEAATEPMARAPYVRFHPRVLDATCHRPEDAHLALAVVELAAPPPFMIPDGWASWQRHEAEGEPFAAPPYAWKGALSTLELRIPIDAARLTTPTRPQAEGLPNLLDAQASVEVLVDELNRAALPLLRGLEGHHEPRSAADEGGRDLVGWLRTQIEADKATAAAAGRHPWRYVRLDDDGAYGLELDERRVATAVGFHGDDLLRPVEAIHIALHDPADVTARCQAELALLYEHTPVAEDGVHCPRCVTRTRDAATPCPPEHAPCEVLRLLAFGYRHRPGWKPEWAPAPRDA
ncbi:hypothetical protein HII36_51270 [Nonomuraea sp. NN258]|uniref:DUF6221 family protein n=1 Tax=Nonomuraea antri TaxID=2730852 RepID=UPI00156A1322|nr:DUF6221 family protein [Nonomuraea antri]NRQ40153.1 hypothetical protein [Nonomuraea antri]